MEKIVEEDLVGVLLEASREDGINEVSPKLIFKGVRFFVKNSKLDYLYMAESLIDLGCNFTLEEIDRYAKDNNIEQRPMIDGLMRGDILTGARLLCDIRDSKKTRDYLYKSLIPKEIKGSLIDLYMKDLIREVGFDYKLIHSRKYL